MRYLMTGVLLALLAACGTKPSNDAPPAQIQSVAFRPAAPALTLITIISNNSGAGAHTALYVEGSTGVLFDPAGSFTHPTIPEKGDVLYGMTPAWMVSYRSSHARASHHVVSQRIPVTAAQAELALKLVQARGAVADAQCALSTSEILAQIPGFENIKTGWYPKKLMAQIDTIPGVQKSKLFENDDGNVLDGIAALN